MRFMVLSIVVARKRKKKMFKQIFYLILSFLMLNFLSTQVYAYKLNSLGIGLSARSESAADDKNENYLADRALFVLFDTSFNNWVHQLELRKLSKETEDGILIVNFERIEFNNWAVRYFKNNSFADFFAGPGFSISQDQVNTQLVGIDSKKSTGDTVISLGALGGIQKLFFEKLVTQLSLEYFVPLLREERDTELAVSLKFGYSFL
jgi:hypothetical protein